MQANGLPSFPIDVTYIPAILKRITLAFQVGRILRKHQQLKRFFWGLMVPSRLFIAEDRVRLISGYNDQVLIKL